MKATRRTLDLFQVQSATARNKNYIESTLRQVREYEGDVHREQRLKERECPWCFYFRRSRLAGQAFTDWACLHCGKEDMHADTGHPYLCDECSDKLRLCKTCCADIDLTKRNKLERKVWVKRSEPG